MLNDEAPRQVLIRLARLAQRRRQGREWLEDAFDRDPERLPEIAIEVAIETGDPIGQVLARWIEKRASPERETVELHGEPALARPEVRQDELIRGLANLAATLDDCGRPDEAREARREAEKLASGKPQNPRYE